MTERNEDIIEITDENGEKLEVELIDMITFENIEYAILSPIEKCSHEDCDCESDYVLMKVKKDGEEYSFETIEDNEEFEKVAAYIDELADEIE